VTLSIPLNPIAEERLRHLAEQAGTDVTGFISQLIEQVASTSASKHISSPNDFDQAMDELFAGDTRKLPPISLNYSREEIYFEHD
jgi:hypothetical protein